MEKQIASGQIGTVGDYSIEFTGGKLKLIIEIGADPVIDEIEKAIPGQIDDAVLEILRKLLKV